MTGIILTWVLIALGIVLIIVAVPMWRARHRRPDYRDARRHYRAKDRPRTPSSTSDYVPTEPVPATDGLTVARTPLAEPDEEQAGR